jgi:hypothetical protein
MRSKKMAAALAVGAALLALAPAGATARRGPLGLGGCNMTLNAAPRLVQSSETALLFGRLTCRGGTSVSGQTISFFEHAAGTSGASAIGSSSTDSAGLFQTTTPALVTNSTFFATALGGVSSRRTVKVAPKVTISGPPDGAVLYTGRGKFLHIGSVFSNRVTFSGQVSPSQAGAQVSLQRENAIGGEEWHRIGRGVVGPTGAYSIPHTFRIPGSVNIRVVARRTKTSAPGISESLSYVIMQSQNPNLTIFSSKNPVFYGEPVTISGEDKAGEGVKLTLFARSSPGKAWVPVALTTTTAGGAYAFAAQTPLVKTSYKVAGGGVNSAALFEGVKYALTASPAASSVAQGTPILFTGTVTPAVAGHAIYLQVQNQSGIGFHVLQVGTVSASGTYSVGYIPFVLGTRKYRVRVPGDPANQGASSALFTISVTPAPLALINPEPPGNSKPPSEGHN